MKTIILSRFFVKKFWIFFIYFLLIIFSAYLLPASKHKYLFLFYAFVVFVILLNVSKSEDSQNSSETIKHRKFFIGLLILSVLILLIIRLIPFIRFGEAPLGYDTGFYLYRFSVISNAGEKPFYFSFLPYFFLGMSPLTALQFFYVITQFLIAGGLYILIRALKIAFNFELAVLSLFLFAVSITQFQAYWWMFGQQALATGLLLATIALIFRRSALAIFTAVLGIAIHPPTFIILVFAVLVVFLIQIWRLFQKKEVMNLKLFYIVGVGLFVSAIVAILNFEIFLNYFKLYILEYKGMSTNFPFWQVLQMKGLFISPLIYNLTTLFLIPFAVFSFLRPKIWFNDITHHGNQSVRIFLIFLYTIFVGLFVLIAFPFIYQHRFIILFDIFLIIFAVPSLLILVRYLLHDKTGKILFVILIFVFSLRIGMFVWAQQPQVFQDELEEIKSMTSIPKRNTLIIATNATYTPWILGFSGQAGFGPGYGEDRWSFYDWMKFWQSDDNNERYELLAAYPNNTIYLFIGDREKTSMPYQQHIRNNPHFIQISPRVWQYQPILEDDYKE